MADITEQLEALVDKHGLLHVLTGLACICREKADRSRVYEQDKSYVKQWDRDADICDRAAADTVTS